MWPCPPRALLQSDAILVLPAAPDLPLRLDAPSKALDEYRAKAMQIVAPSSMSGLPQVRRRQHLLRLPGPLQLLWSAGRTHVHVLRTSYMPRRLPPCQRVSVVLRISRPSYIPLRLPSSRTFAVVLRISGPSHIPLQLCTCQTVAVVLRISTPTPIPLQLCACQTFAVVLRMSRPCC